jgi:hypothetical protein
MAVGCFRKLLAVETFLKKTRLKKNAAPQNMRRKKLASAEKSR